MMMMMMGKDKMATPSWYFLVKPGETTCERIHLCFSSTPLPLPLSLSASPFLLSFHIYDRPVMCTQDRRGTARWPLLPWKQSGELEETFFSLFFCVGCSGLHGETGECVKKAAVTHKEKVCVSVWNVKSRIANRYRPRCTHTSRV